MAQKGAAVNAADDLIKAYEKLNSVLGTTGDKTNLIVSNAQKAAAAIGGVSGNPNTSGTSLVPEPTFTGGGGGGGWSTAKNVMGAFGNLAMGAVGVASNLMPSTQDAVSLQLIKPRANWAGYQGSPTELMKSAMFSGTSTGQMDAANAMSYGSANGISAGLGSYGQVFSGVSTMSNLVPGMGLTGGMQAAVGLNQADSVNALRMAGINVRDAKGNMRNPTDIFKEFYNYAVNSAGKGRAPSKDELATSLQSGNAFSNMLDQFFGKNTELRQSMQAAATQFVGGGDLSKTSLTGSGAVTAALNSQSNVNATGFDALQAAMKPLAAGFTEANNLISKFNTSMAHLYENSKLAQDALKQLAKMNTLAGSQMGQAAVGMVSLLSNFVGSIAGIFAAKSAGSLLGGGGGAEAGALRTGVGAVAKKAGLAGLVFGGLELVQHGLNSTLGKHLPKGLVQAGNFAFDLGEGAAVGFAAGGPGAAVAGTVAFGAGGLATDFKDPGGSGNGQGASAPTSGGQTDFFANTGGGSAIRIASTQLGVPYSWGGGSTNGPTSGMAQGKGTVGFDCSSLMVYVFSKMGVRLPRTSQEQQKVGKRIDPLKAQPGDLIFWGEPAHHVALYVGNNQMIQAPHTGGYVEKVYVDLHTCSSASRVLDSATGTTVRTDLVNKTDNSTNMNIDGTLLNQFPELAGLMGASSPLTGSSYNPTSAMEGTTAGGSGLGLGATSEYTPRLNTAMSAMRASTPYSRTASGAHHDSSGDTHIHYGGVTFQVNVPANAKFDEKVLSRQMTAELKNLGIKMKVVNE